MSNPDVFFHLIPYQDRAEANLAIRLKHNQRWFDEGSPPYSREEAPGATPVPYEFDDIDPETRPRLKVTFSELEDLPERPTLANGIIFGTSPRRCHIVLGEERQSRGISGKHFEIFVDEDHNVFLKDLRSAYGTAVSRNGQGYDDIALEGIWHLRGKPGFPTIPGETVVRVGDVAFEVEFPNHDDPNDGYINNLEAFRRACEEAERGSPEMNQGGFGSLQNLARFVPTGTHEMYYDLSRIHSGSNSEIIQVKGAAYGVCYAAKRFYPLVNISNQAEMAEWNNKIQKEYDIVRKAGIHPNIVTMRDLVFRGGQGKIIMDLYNGCNMQKSSNFDRPTLLTAFWQVLSGLSHLHGQGIVHRNIKPENILVQQDSNHWPLPSVQRFVIADFGSAALVPADGKLPTSFCGGTVYLAPECYPEMSLGHGFSCDIWSLGVILLEWIAGLPRQPQLPIPRSDTGQISPERWQLWSHEWCSRLTQKISDMGDSWIKKLLTHMVARQVCDRWSAQECLTHGFGLWKARECDGTVMSVEDMNEPLPPGNEWLIRALES